MVKPKRDLISISDLSFKDNTTMALQIEIKDIKHKVKMDSLKKYLFGAKGEFYGDVVENPTLVESGTYGLHGGRFGCTRVTEASCNAENHSYVTPRGPGIGLGIQFHSGIDIYQPLNMDLKSLMNGTIVSFFKDAPSYNVPNSLGNFVIIKTRLPDNTNIWIKYCHLTSVSKESGIILKGEVFGKSGRTGNAWNIETSRYHVHIEASTDGVFFGGQTRVDPENYFKTKFDNNGNPIED